MSKHDALLRWRSESVKTASAKELADSLTVENLPDAQTPEEMYERVVAFRHLRSDAREQACRSFLRRFGT